VTAELNERLDDEVRKAQEIISIAIKRKDDPVDFFKVHYKPEKSLESILQTIDSTEREKFLNDVNLNKDICFQIDDYIKTKTKKVSADMPRKYRNMKDHLLAFEAFRKKPVTFESLDINF
ncbi:MAG: site-specific integrase, partial [Rhizobacter sp.]|nr:site-specific integrase [Ferruginibacter sp.]